MITSGMTASIDPLGNGTAPTTMNAAKTVAIITAWTDWRPCSAQ